MKQKAILIVDDIELNRAVLCELFRKRYRILEAGDGFEALRLIRERRDELAVVLLDIVMPVLDGFGVLEAMREEHLIDRVPVILITAENSETAVLRGYELGVSDVINKPFSPSIVHRRVENVIELYRHRFRLERIVSQQKAAMDLQARKLERLNISGRLRGACGGQPERSAPGQDGGVSRRVLWLLELEREKYRLLSEMSGDIVFNYDVQADVMEFTENAREIFGRETKYSHFISFLRSADMMPPGDRELLIERLRNPSPEKTADCLRIRIRTKRGTAEWFEIYLKALWDRENNRCAELIGKITNINDIKTEADRWREEAYRDPLTALYNRKAVEELSRKLLLTGAADEKQAILFFVDIDNFKQLNDQLGHLYGDEILKYVGREMQRRFRSTDIVGRIGGDEFVVVVNSSMSMEDIRRKAEELCCIFREAPCAANPAPPISGSVGIACGRSCSADFRELLHKADIALYAAKNQGKNRYAFYSGQTH